MVNDVFSSFFFFFVNTASKFTLVTGIRLSIGMLTADRIQFYDNTNDANCELSYLKTY